MKRSHFVNLFIKRPSYN